MTTSPSTETFTGCDTSGRVSAPEALAIRWVFPETELDVVDLRRDEVVFGRGPECTVVLSGPERSHTSRRHARTVREGQLCLVQDLGSRDGTFLNGRRVRQAVLFVGDVIRLGDWVGVVIRVSGSTKTKRDSSLSGQTSAGCKDGDAGVGSGEFVHQHGMWSGPVLRPVLEFAERSARAGLSVVLEGETGTGKELMARAIHGWSGRGGPFVAVDCASIPDALVEAELFGHGRGAFTGAVAARPGKFRAATGGTVFLDEVSRLPLAVQPKLLRTLQERAVVSLGESVPRPIDVLVLAATQRPLRELVAEGSFTMDLQMRIEQVTVALPALRERRQEIGFMVAQLLLESAAGNPPVADARLMEALCLYDWPGNVRELSSVINRLVRLYSDQGILRRSCLPAHIARREAFDGATRALSSSDQPDSPGLPAPRATFRRPDAPPCAARVDLPRASAPPRSVTRDEVLEALRDCGGNLTRAAAALATRRQDLYRLVSKDELEVVRAECRLARGERGDG